MLYVSPATIASVDRSDEANVIATLVSAFIADPVERWLFAEPLRYLTQFAWFVAAFGSGGFESETVFSLGDFAAGGDLDSAGGSTRRRCGRRRPERVGPHRSAGRHVLAPRVAIFYEHPSSTTGSSGSVPEGAKRADLSRAKGLSRGAVIGSPQ